MEEKVIYISWSRTKYRRESRVISASVQPALATGCQWNTTVCIHGVMYFFYVFDSLQTPFRQTTIHNAHRPERGVERCGCWHHGGRARGRPRFAGGARGHGFCAIGACGASSCGLAFPVLACSYWLPHVRPKVQARRSSAPPVSPSASDDIFSSLTPLFEQTADATSGHAKDGAAATRDRKSVNVAEDKVTTPMTDAAATPMTDAAATPPDNNVLLANSSAYTLFCWTHCIPFLIYCLVNRFPITAGKPAVQQSDAKASPPVAAKGSSPTSCVPICTQTINCISYHLAVTPSPADAQ